MNDQLHDARVGEFERYLGERPEPTLVEMLNTKLKRNEDGEWRWLHYPGQKWPPDCSSSKLLDLHERGLIAINGEYLELTAAGHWQAEAMRAR